MWRGSGDAQLAGGNCGRDCARRPLRGERAHGRGPGERTGGIGARKKGDRMSRKRATEETFRAVAKRRVERPSSRACRAHATHRVLLFDAQVDRVPEDLYHVFCMDLVWNRSVARKDGLSTTIARVLKECG